MPPYLCNNTFKTQKQPFDKNFWCNMNWNKCGHAFINQSQRLIPSQSLAKINETLKPFDTCVLQIHTQKNISPKANARSSPLKQQGHTFNLCPQRGPSTTLQLHSMSFHGQNIKCGPNAPCLHEDTFKIISQMFNSSQSFYKFNQTIWHHVINSYTHIDSFSKIKTTTPWNQVTTTTMLSIFAINKSFKCNIAIPKFHHGQNIKFGPWSLFM